MIQINRLTGNSIPENTCIDINKTINFSFNNQYYSAYQGDTIASALLANGVNIVGRSFKYGRPRGIIAAGAEEPNAILQLGRTEETQVPNIRATQQLVYEGLACFSTNGWPSADVDVMGILGKVFGKYIPPGFYYKTFMAPRALWMGYEKLIRKGAGLGRSPKKPDPDIYDVLNQTCDVLIIGAGVAGLMAALTIAKSGARLILVSEQNEYGGNLLSQSELINDLPAKDWVDQVIANLSALENVTLLNNATVNGYHDHNFLSIHERITDHSHDLAPKGEVRQRMHRVRAKHVILATGAHERPLVFAHNDIPGCILASAVSTYLHRYSVAAGNKLILMTTNDNAYQTAFDWQNLCENTDKEVVAIIDTRLEVGEALKQKAAQLGIPLILGSAVIEACGRTRVNAAWVATVDFEQGKVTSEPQKMDCDTIAISGGWSPAVHLSCHTGGRPQWRDDIQGFVPDDFNKDMSAIGAANGTYALSDILTESANAGIAVVEKLGLALNDADSIKIPKVAAQKQAESMPLYMIPHTKKTSRAPKQFVDFQLDVTAAGIELAIQEGFESIEHVKRYTAMGFGTDQGKLSNINGMAIAAKKLGQTIPETGTTIFRPNYTPVTFGAIVGRNANEFFDSERYTAMHQWHLHNGAEFEDVGQWKRPWYYPKSGETQHDAVNRECLAVRQSVGILDASTLGKIDIQGPDAREFLNRIYTNAWSKLPVGRCRYGLMCGEDGMVFDDGVTACLSDNHFVMTTTTGGAARVFSWLELWHQTEWPELDVYFTTVTDHWATMAISGPNARQLLAELTDIELDPEQFKFMDWREGKVAGVPARVFRISFTGEQSYEINVQANYGLTVWEKLIEHGEKYQLTPYGTETMHVLRAEKGFIIVGQDSDGSMTPADLGMSWAVAKNKAFSFIGKRSMAREDCVRENRKQLVGLKTTVEPKTVIPEGSQIVFDSKQELPMTMVGHVTSSYYSPILEHSVALAVVKGGLKRMGEKVFMPQADGTTIEAEICNPVFYDPQGERQNV